MKTTGRLALLGMFAAVGVGLAVCVGTLIGMSEPQPSKPPQLTALIHAVDDGDVVDLGSAKPLPSSVIEEATVLSQIPDEQTSKEEKNIVLSPPTALPPALSRRDRGQESLLPTMSESAEKHNDIPASPVAPLPPVASTTSVSLVPRTTAKPASPGLPYAQQAIPPVGGSTMNDVLNLLRKGLSDSPDATAAPRPAERVPAPSPSPATPRKKTMVDGEGNGKLRIHIYDEDIRKVLDLLSEQGNLNILASKNVEGKVSASLNGVDIDSALNAILKSTGFVSRHENNFIFVGTPEDFDSIEQGLDRVGTRVYRPSYITAGELKSLITPLLTEKAGVISVSTPSEAGIANNDSVAGGDTFSGSEVLVVRDYEAVLAQIDQMVTEVDIRPLQVSIEAMILSVKLKDEDKFGVNFQLLRQNPNIKFGLGSPPTSLSDVAFPLNGGLRFGFLDSNLGAFIEALETVGDTNVIANPRLMVLNKQRAEIQIGEKKGYINQTVTETSSSQSVEFLDIGAQLRLRPFISSDGLIRMEVHPELSDGDVKVEKDFTLPNKTLTQVTTNIMVRDGCTVIIGGLIKEQLTNTTTQIPVLGNLPVVGFAFRQTNESTERHEVLVLITPRIIYEPGSCQEGEKGACEFLRRQSTYADKMSPFGKRSIARRYFRLAEGAYAQGDNQKALRFAEMAVQFDPVNLAALELRSDIWQGKPYCLRNADVDMPLENPLEGKGMAGWLIDDLEEAPAEPPLSMHPLDPGVPGGHRDLVKPTTLK